VSEASTHHARRRAGLLLGAALLLVAVAWLAGRPAGGDGPAAASPAPGSRASSAATALAALEPEPARSAAAPLAGSAPQPPQLAMEPDPNERELYQAYLARYAQDPDALAREAERVLRADAARNRKVALLRAAWDLGLPVAPQLFQQALRSPADDADRHAVSLADFALRFLSTRAEREPLAWTTLFDSVHMGATSMVPRVRNVAAASLIESASQSDLPRVVALAQEEPQGALARGVIAALRARSDEAARAALRDLGVDHLALEARREEQD
jgi:hypothetical protein